MGGVHSRVNGSSPSLQNEWSYEGVEPQNRALPLQEKTTSKKHYASAACRGYIFSIVRFESSVKGKASI
jgi:hypothetical protein